jgi:hypothetical protein
MEDWNFSNSFSVHGTGMENLCNHQMPVAKYRSLEVFRSKACGR